MSNPFQPGDIVRCTDDRDCRGVRKGLTYLVLRTDESCIVLHAREESRYLTRRFVLEYRATQQPQESPATSATPDEDRQIDALPKLPSTTSGWLKLLAAGVKFRFRSGSEVRFVAFEAKAKPHCQLVMLNSETGNIVTRYASGKASEEPYSDPGDILVAV